MASRNFLEIIMIEINNICNSCILVISELLNSKEKLVSI